jgi:phage terminase Nu1 subunit (DNA packaging protein)
MSDLVRERYVDARELAATLGVSATTVKRWVAAGAPSETWGMRVRRFRVSEVVAWLRDSGTLLAEPQRPRGAATPPGRPPGDI